MKSDIDSHGGSPSPPLEEPLRPMDVTGVGMRGRMLTFVMILCLFVSVLVDIS